jgi:replication factor A1
MAVADYTDQMWLQGFNDTGVAVLSMSADELMDLKASVLAIVRVRS